MTNNLKALRIKAGYTQQQVAKLLGKNIQDRLSHWERGTATPSIKNLLALGKLYNVAIEDMYSTTTN